MNKKYKFIELLDTNTENTIHAGNRHELNAIIKMYNQWQLDGLSLTEKPRLLAYIEYGKQILAPKSSMYEKILDDMDRFVNEFRGC